MKIKLIAPAFLIVIFSCNTSDKKTSVGSSNESTQSGNIEEQKKQLNEQSQACIALMNLLDQNLHAAYVAHDSKTAEAIQLRIDSAAMENAKIGQKLMALDK